MLAPFFDEHWMVASRLTFYQTAAAGRFACEENRQAFEHIAQALHVLNERTRQREQRAVEGTHQA